MRLMLAALLLLAFPPSAFSMVPTVDGPAKAPVGSLAELDVPQYYHWVDKAHISEFMKSLGNIPRDSELGALIGDREGKDQWFALFEFDDVGYIKDASSEKLDADELIKSIKEGNEEANEERKRQGYATLEVIGWGKAPFYNPDTQRLEWSVLARDSGTEIVNYKTRILGKSGVMSVVLVCDAASVDRVMPDFQKALEGYRFVTGEKYAEWKEGDKVAAIGLAALVLGGVAAKTGFLAKFAKFFIYALKYMWKLVLVAIAAIGAAIKKFFEWVSGKKEKPEGYVPQSTSAHAAPRQSPTESAASANGPPSERPSRSEAQPTMDDPKP